MQSCYSNHTIYKGANVSYPLIMVTSIKLKFLGSNSHISQITRMRRLIFPAQNSDVQYLITEKATFRRFDTSR